MTDRTDPALDAAAVATLLAAANAPVKPERHSALVGAASYVVAAGRRLAAAGLDRLATLTPCEGLGDE